MRLKKALAVAVTGALVVGSMAGCGSKKDSSSSKDGASKGNDAVTYESVKLGETGKDLKTTITMFNNRTDLDSDKYNGTTWKQYLAEFNKMYPNITVKIKTDTNYADDALTHLQSGDYETIMGIPSIDKSDLSTYFISYGTLDDMKKQVNYSNTWEYNGDVYGVASLATTQGIVYNKKVFEKAGITELPKTPEEFIDALQKIKDKTDAIPLYTNYAAGWTMGAWDAYIGINATGDNTYMNQKLVHTKDPFKDYGDDTHAYSVYKILYDAVNHGLTEEDYSTTDWEGCKVKINDGKIGCMVLGSWAYPQMAAAGKNGDDIGYMPFPISIDGKQYASAGADYSYGINANATNDEKEAAMIFVKWLTEKSGYCYNEGGLPVIAGNTDTKLAFDNVSLIEDEAALKGEEDYLNDMNSESELNINNSGNDKIQAIIESASKGDKKFDDIMKEWNKKWSDAQNANGIKVTD